MLETVRRKADMKFEEMTLPSASHLPMTIWLR